MIVIRRLNIFNKCLMIEARIINSIKSRAYSITKAKIQIFGADTRSLVLYQPILTSLPRCSTVRNTKDIPTDNLYGSVYWAVT
jgi:hypothetical protein